MAVLSGLEPKAVFEYFEKLCAVPHGSGNTKQISDLCVGFAKELGLRWRQDEANNVVIWKDASPGCEDAPAVILQGHIDMVCVKTEDCAKDMAREGLDLRTDGGWVWAERTSLGGDNGIAVAMILAILADGRLPHPPLEAVFTVDEEVGLEGAFALDCSDLKGRKLVNLDSEEEGVFTVSCAGGVRVDCFLPGVKAPLNGEAGYEISLEGLLGGHSGAEIHKGRASANQVMGRVLYSAMERIPGLRLADIRGGKFDNVICSRNHARAAVPADRAEEFEDFIREFDKALKNEYAGCDGGIALSCEKTALDKALSPESTANMLRTLLAVPQGVQAMNVDFPGLVQTSLNLGVMELTKDLFIAHFSIRSSVRSRKYALCRKLEFLCELLGGEAESTSEYPEWAFRSDSPLRETLCEAYRELTGKTMQVQAIHAGLECGLFNDKLPGMDMVSIGPDMKDIHTTAERLSIASAARTWELLCEVLKRLR